jgi:hypothetical protein
MGLMLLTHYESAWAGLGGMLSDQFVTSHEPEEDGGLEQLKKFVATNGITWPQYYLAYDSHRVATGEPTNDLSESWGISGIPTVFIVDTEGKLYSTEARGRLETLIPRLPKESKASSLGR